MGLQLITVWNAQLKLSNQSWLMESGSRPGRQLWMPWEILKPECVQTVSVSTDVCKATLGFAYDDYLSCLDRGEDRSPFSKLIRAWVWMNTVLPCPVLPVQVSVFCLESQLKEKPAGGGGTWAQGREALLAPVRLCQSHAGVAQTNSRRQDSTALFSPSAHAGNLNLEAFSFSASLVSSQIELSVEKIKEAESLKTLTLTCF